MPGSTHKAIWMPIVFVSAVLFAGCQAAMSTSTTTSDSVSTNPTHLAPVEWPLRFKSHSFSARCYDTYGCKVRYANVWQAMDDDDKFQRASSTYGANYLDGWSGDHIGIRNFPSPAEVSWRCKDGIAHEAKIDIGEIFKDELIRHNVRREDIADQPDGKYDFDPSVLLEVNDRTIRVYMSSFIPTKHLQRPESKHSDYRDDLILVKTYTY